MSVIGLFDPVEAVRKASIIAGLDQSRWVHDGDLFGVMVSETMIWNPLVDTDAAMALLFIMDGSVSTNVDGHSVATTRNLSARAKNVYDYTTGIRVAVTNLAAKYYDSGIAKDH